MSWLNRITRRVRSHQAVVPAQPADMLALFEDWKHDRIKLLPPKLRGKIQADRKVRMTAALERFAARR